MQVAIGIVIVALVIYVAIVAFQKYISTQVTKLKTKQAAIPTEAVQTAIEETGKLSLTGGSLEKYQQLTADFADVTDVKLPRASTQTEQIQQQARSINFLGASQAVKKTNLLLDRVQSTCENVQQGLADLQQADAEHRRAVERLEKKYQALRKTLLSKNFAFGPSIDALEDQLSSLEGDFDQFSTLTKNGDHDEAATVLTKLQADTTDLEQKIKDIPDIYKDLATGFPDQLDEILTGYGELTKQHYHFEPLDIPAEVETVRAKIKANNATLAKLDVVDAQNANQAIEKQIDGLYAAMQTELDAKPEVAKGQIELGKFMTHARNQNHALEAELDRLSESYTLNNQEVERTRQLSEQLKNIETTYQEDVNALTNQTAVYSAIAEHFKDQDAQLHAIEDEQVKISEGVKSLTDEEEHARETLQRFDFQIHAIKRHVENLNLPGLPDDYLDYFFVVSDEIEKLDKDINQMVINMDDITKQLIVIQADMSTLEEKTTDLADSAVLAEQLLQYANRYKNSHKEVQAASDESQRLFNDQYQYAKSLEVIATAVDKVEPGAYKRIEDSYYASQKTDSEAPATKQETTK